MGETFDKTVVQQTIIDVFLKERKPKKVIVKIAGVSETALFKHNHKLVSERKICMTNAALRGLYWEFSSTYLGKILKLWPAAGVRGLIATTDR